MARMEKDVAVREVDEKWRNVVADKDKKWQNALADKDAEIAQLRAQLQKQNGKSN